MRKLSAFAFCALFAPVLVPAEAHALALRVAAACGEDCSSMKVTETWNSYAVELGERADLRKEFRRARRDQRVGSWKERVWRARSNRSVITADDPIAPTPDPVPEPGTLGLMALGGAFVANRIRKRRAAEKI